MIETGCSSSSNSNNSECCHRRHSGNQTVVLGRGGPLTCVTAARVSVPARTAAVHTCSPTAWPHTHVTPTALGRQDTELQDKAHSGRALVRVRAAVMCRPPPARRAQPQGARWMRGLAAGPVMTALYPALRSRYRTESHAACSRTSALMSHRTRNGMPVVRHFFACFMKDEATCHVLST